ncbi:MULTISPECIES: EF-hand domain-containing protein [Streptomyces]|jgi:Ca2+-binding EF-hand superfamily protein|uniref:Ca2+-binding EF-hand superfamily protein n=1 Tax=Streptomyces nymphaeiformis TaxID=2663842 RepID=A0A7W7XE80_9ACTN|nr:EF-hand domain-containing protein [Streptomyces nymphaeiformis]MBB4984812.1 Ca2+-binding EF-hand superfamily protein [Streptomyces nymphaeiformis]
MSPHEVDQLLDRKLDVCFGHGDQNGDGVLESADALALAARIVAYIGEPFGSDKAQDLFKAFGLFWQHVSAATDLNKDGQVTPEEWRTGLRRAFAEDEAGFTAGFRPLAEALWAICDQDDDGSVDAPEFANFQKAFGTSEENSRIAFSKLDRDGDGSLSVDELLVAWKEYYTSPDPDAPGNWLFGDIWQKEIWDGTRVSL